MNRTAAALLATATLLLTGCSTGTPTAPTGTLREQLQDHGITTIGLQESTIQSTGNAVCKARDAGLSHREVANVTYEHLGDFYTPREVETLTHIWYGNLCPEHDY